MNFKQKVIQYVIGTVTSCMKNDGIEIKIKIENKYRWETLDDIPLLTLVGVNHRQPILIFSKRMVHIYSIDDSINQFAIGYMINPSLHFNKTFI